MKNMQLAEDEPGRWKRLCLRELSGLKKLQRKSKEPARLQLDGGGGCGSFQVELQVRQHVRGGGGRLGVPGGSRPEEEEEEAPPELAEGGGGVEALDMRKAPFPAGLLASPQRRLRKDACLGPVGVNGAEGRAFPARSLPSRMVVCQPRRPPLESSYAPAPPPPPPPAVYSGAPDPALSPRKRPGEPAGVPSEIKALQQTRRLLANARERTRVHTISAAFEALRKQVPCYSYGQKLSKLAILRIACNYILSLARLADLDYSADHSNMSFLECVEQCTRTLQAEGRSKKRKE